VDNKETAEAVWDLRQDILSYSNYKMARSIGLTITPKDISFEKAMIYGFIEEKLTEGNKR
jgi:predicted ester cyclase